MNILLITSRYLPIFNKNDEGAIEKLEQIYLLHNEKTTDKFTVYSPKIAEDNYDNKILKNTTFRTIDETTVSYKIHKTIYAIKKRMSKTANNEAYIRTVAKDIIRKNEQNNYDLIIFENGERDIPTFKKLTKTKTKIVLHLHNDYVNKDVKNSRSIIDSCNEIWTVSQFLANQITGVKSTNITVIPNTAPEPKSIKPSSCKKLRNELELKDGITFIYVGRLLEQKGILQLLEAFNQRSKYKPNDNLLVIGKTETDKNGKALQAKIQKLAKSNSGIKLVGFIRPEELPNYLNIVDCQIIPSTCNEAFGLVVLEAMQAKLQIIASQVGGIPEIGRQKIEYVDPSNLEKELVKKMSKVVKDKRIDYSEILSNYTNESFCRNMYNAIHKESR